MRHRPRLLVFIPSYNAARHIEWVLSRLPEELVDEFDTHVLVLDDASPDDTVAIATAALEQSAPPFSWEVLANPHNLGYGGNQKLGYQYAIRRDMDVVVMVHGDGQYPPEQVGPLARAALEAGAAFGSRFGSPGAARDGGMPMYKYVGNRILTRLQNRLLGTQLTEFHSGFRAYSVAALRRIPFWLCSNDFHFDTEIFIQCLRSGVNIAEFAIPTRYGDEECHVNGLKYARNVVSQSVRARLQDVGLVYEHKYDLRSPADRYMPKIGFASPSDSVLAVVGPNSRVLDLGSSAGHLAEKLVERGCRVVCVDRERPRAWVDRDGVEFVRADLDEGIPPLDGAFDVVLVLDVVEHLREPERFVAGLGPFCSKHDVRQLLVSTGNVAFFPQRMALALGQFNYGPRGILDMTHTRLFTFRSFRRLWIQGGFTIEAVSGIPAPFPLAVGRRRVARLLLAVNSRLIRIRKQLFSYQIFAILRPPVDLDALLEESHARAAVLGTANRIDSRVG